MSEPSILVDRRDGYCVVTLNRPDRLNAFNDAMHLALSQVLAEIEADESCRALMITGAGRAFCAGQDLNDRLVKAGEKLPPSTSLAQYYNPLVRKLRALPFPVVAAVNGIAAGAGCNIALACDLVLAARSASFVQSFARIGLIPDSGGTWFLPRLVGDARARGLALLAEPLPAEKAEQWGLIWKCVDDASLVADAGVGVDQARARCLGGQHARRPARSRARPARHSARDAGLHRGRARLHGKAQTQFHRPQGEQLMDAATLARACADAMWADDATSRELGLQLISVEPGHAVLVMTVTETMVNWHNTCHGGFIYLLADTEI